MFSYFFNLTNMTTYRIPGIYQEEILSIPPSIEEVDTAIPAFVGYTAKATRKESNDLLLVPAKLGSIREFEAFYGFPYENNLKLVISSDAKGQFSVSEMEESALKYLLYYSVRIYFENGGGPCYILSVGLFSSPQKVLLKGSYGSPNSGLLDGLNKLAEVPDVTLIVIPEAVCLPAEEYSVLVQSVLLQCSTLGNRFAILDLYEGKNPSPDLKLNRSLFGNKFLSYGSAYYPFVRTKMTQFVSPDCHNVSIEYRGEVVQLGFLKTKNSLLYKFVRRTLNNRFVVLPPSGAVAGVYVTTDKNRGPWKSPANIGLKGVVEPVLAIDNQLYDLFNAGLEPGKSINNIRSFPGKGILVLGSRTLASNDNEKKYIPVSRFIIMVKETLKRSTSWVVFEPNDAVTWAKIRTIIENYLIQKWQEGALAGVSQQSSFYVRCGLGETMTDQDIVTGKTNIEVGLALLRPSEFTVFSYSHQSRAAATSLQIA